MLWIKDGTLICPAGNRMFQGDILIEDGKIAAVYDHTKGKRLPEKLPEEAEIIEAKGLLVGPGLIDTHVHFRDPGLTYKEDIFSGSEAAKKGGYTGIVLMANTKPVVDNAETLKYVLDRGHQTNIHIYSCVNVTKGMKGEEITDMELLSECGAAGFTDDGIPLLQEKIIREAMERAKVLRKPISFHEENPERIANNGIHAGKAAAYYGIGGSPREAEIDLVERDLKLALATGAEVVIQHISTKESVALLCEAKKQAGNVHGEATPHHFTLTEDAAIAKGTLAKMNPPLREEEDRLAIIEGLKDGTIDLIATDHAPHSRQEKALKITEAPSGIIGLETALSLGIRELVDKGYLTYPELFQRMSAAPAALYRLQGGNIAVGEAADLVLFDPKEKWVVREEEFFSKSANSPFIGETMPGVIHYTICDGAIVYQKEEGRKERLS